jgi:hypothetical protein
MAISSERAAKFSSLGGKAIRQWLVAAVEEYFGKGHGPESFAPFELFFPAAPTAAAALAPAYDVLSPAGKMKFRSALSNLVRLLSADQTEAWVFVAELIWRIKAHDAVSEVERRFNEAFIKQLTRRSRKPLDTIVAYIRNTDFEKKTAAVRFLHRIVSSTYFNDAQTQTILVRLCEIDPDGWTNHLRVTRDRLHAQMVRLRERHSDDYMRETQDRLALQIYRSIGYERFIEGLKKLDFVTDAPFWEPTDNWLWRALVERTGEIVPGPDGWVAPSDRPKDRCKLANHQLRSAPPIRRVVEERRITSAPAEVSQALGDNIIEPVEQDEELETLIA